jgi:raffinose/stachyose/melibiose transport system substrate-binding protein
MSKAPDGHIYAMPLTHNFLGVYYNIDIFNTHGLTIPTTYNDFINTCKKLKAAGVLPLIFSFQTPGRIGHTFQAMNSAWTMDGVERLAAVMTGGKIENDPVMLKMAQRILEVASYGNEDAFSTPDIDGMWEGFANERAAMCIVGSYARGPLLLSHPKLNMGVFPLPNDTDGTTTLVAGIDAALSISAGANEKKKEAALTFLEFLSRTENAQIFCDIEGAPNCVTTVLYLDNRLDPIIAKMKRGPLHDWFASTIPGNVQNAIYNDVQQFLIDKNPAQFLVKLQQTIITESAQ